MTRSVAAVIGPATIVVSVALAACGPDPGADAVGTGVLRISGPPDCDECRLEMTLEVKLRDRPDLGRQVVGSKQAVIRDPRGRVFHVHGGDASSIHVFDADGTFIQSVGSRGQGPGQFSYIYALVLDDEANLYAFDRERMTVFSPGFEILEVKQVPLRVHQALLLPDGFVVASPSFSEDAVGLPLHLLDEDLQVVRSFAATGETEGPEWQTLQARGISKSLDGLIWAHPPNRYLIEEWDPTTGTRHQAFERTVEWFEPWVEHRGLSVELPPQPRLSSVWQDDEGLLWTVSAVGAEKWHEGLVVLPGFNDLWIEYPEQFWDSHIEVIDPSTGRLLLSERVPQALGRFTNDGLVIGRRYPEGEFYQVDLWKLELVR